MANHNKVVWAEGMFMQPQHFQQHDRYIEHLIRQLPTSLGAYAWGISELKIDQPLLSLGKIAIASCKGILPDGTAFDIPSSDNAPIPLEIPTGVNNSIVYLALPLQRAGMPETGYDSSKHICRYCVHDEEVSDSNYGFNSTVPIQIGKLSLRLMLEQEDRAGYTYLGIIRIKESQANHNIILDEHFIPACIDIRSTPIISKFLHELVSLLNYRAEALAQRVVAPLQESASAIADFMLLQAVNRAEPLFTHLACSSRLHPEWLYYKLLELMGELATLTCEKRRPITLPTYQHDNLQQTYQPLIEELRRSLSMVLEQNAIAIPLEQHQYGVWVAALIDKNLIAEATFVLAAYADIPLDEMQTRFLSQIKIAAVEHIRTLVTKGLPGIDLQLLAVAPRQIAYHANFTYFTLNRKNSFWQTLEKSGGIAFHVAGNFPGLKLELWAIRG